MQGRPAGARLGRLLLLTWMAAAAAASAQAPPPAPATGPPEAAPAPEVRVQVEPEQVTVGDRLTVTLEVDTPPERPVSFPSPGDHWGKFAVLQEDPPSSEPVGDLVRQRKTYHLTAFETGSLDLPALELTREGEEPLQSPVQSIEVASVLDGESQDPADIKPPAFLPIPARWLPWLGLGLLAIVLAAAWWWWRRRRRGGTAASAPAGPPPLPPAEEALAALEQLLAGRLLEQGRIKQFHVELSEIAKRYLWRRYHVPTLERTTFEVLRDARQAGLDGWVTDRLTSVLNACDGVKFARQRPSPPACRASAEELRDLVVRTRPAAEPAPSAAAGDA